MGSIDGYLNSNVWYGCKTMGFDWDLNWDEGHDGTGISGYTPRSMRANEEQ